MPMIERAIALKTAKPALAYYMRGIANEDSGNVRPLMPTSSGPRAGPGLGRARASSAA